MDFFGDFVHEQFKRQINDYKLKAKEQEQDYRQRESLQFDDQKEFEGQKEMLDSQKVQANVTKDKVQILKNVERIQYIVENKNEEHLDGQNPENHQLTEYIVEYNSETGEYLICRENQQKRIHQHAGSPMVELFRINVEDHDAADQEWWWAVCTE